MKTDIELYGDVMDQLNFEPSIDASKITLAAHKGIVTLGGVVSSYAEKHEAEQAANSVYGVKAVANELTVDLVESIKRSDAEIAKAAAEALAWNVMVPHQSIKIAVSKGRITLTGEVDWWYQRHNAGIAVKNLMGVTGINNHIVIKPSVMAIDVKNKIVKEFERSADLDAEQIQVETSGGKVTLKGKVCSWAEIQEAVRGAWSVAGVTQVDNQLAIF